MTETSSPFDEPAVVAARAVVEHPHRDALATLVERYFERKVEGRASGEGIDVPSLLDAELTPSDASTPIGNVVSILDTGPEDERARALLAALIVQRLQASLAAEPDEKPRAIERFVRRADAWIAEHDLPIYALAGHMLDEALAGEIYAAAIAEALATTEPSSLRSTRARSCARLTGLAAAKADSAKQALLEVAQKSPDPALRAYASALAGQTDSVRPVAARPNAKLAGKSEAPIARGFRAFVRIATGWALATWLYRAIERLVGVDRRVEVELVQGGVRVREQVAMLGRTIKERDSTFTTAALAGAGREVRFASVYMLVGLVALGLGVATAVFLAVDGLRSGETWLLLGAAVVLLLGAGFDLALEVLWPAASGRVSVELDLLPRRSLRVARVSREDADRFLEAARVHTPAGK